MITTKWVDSEGKVRITVKYGNATITFPTEKDADNFRKQIEDKILNLA